MNKDQPKRISFRAVLCFSFFAKPQSDDVTRRFGERAAGRAPLLFEQNTGPYYLERTILDPNWARR